MKLYFNRIYFRILFPIKNVIKYVMVFFFNIPIKLEINDLTLEKLYIKQVKTTEKMGYLCTRNLRTCFHLRAAFISFNIGNSVFYSSHHFFLFFLRQHNIFLYFFYILIQFEN